MSGSAAMGSETRTATGRIVLASLVGTAIEFYDFYIYGTAVALLLMPSSARDVSAGGTAHFSTQR